MKLCEIKWIKNWHFCFQKKSCGARAPSSHYAASHRLFPGTLLFLSSCTKEQNTAVQQSIPTPHLEDSPTLSHLQPPPTLHHGLKLNIRAKQWQGKPIHCTLNWGNAALWKHGCSPKWLRKGERSPARTLALRCNSVFTLQAIKSSSHNLEKLTVLAISLASAPQCSQLPAYCLHGHPLPLHCLCLLQALLTKLRLMGMGTAYSP